MPIDWPPAVTMSPVLLTDTVLALPPLAPLPPKARLAVMPAVVLTPAETAKPPLPPPPPMDCARMPADWPPVVLMAPLLVTATWPPAPPAPPLPPKVSVAEIEVLPPAPTAYPPVPPPPPIDCARMPTDCLPAVLIVPLLVTFTASAAAPWPPLPPSATLAETPPLTEPLRA